VSSMGDNSDIDCASCVESAADKNATAARNAAWQTYSFSTKRNSIKRNDSKLSPRYSLLINPLWNTPSTASTITKFGHRAKILYRHSLPRTIHTPLCTLGMRHAERLGLESMPRSEAHHSLIREVRDGVDAFPSDIGRGHVREREEPYRNP